MDVISHNQKRQFERDGVLVIKDFYDVEREIVPIQKHIYEIIGLVAKRHGISMRRPPFDGCNFDFSYLEMIGIDRKLGSEIYDLVKQIPSFIRLIALEKSEALFCNLRGTATAGIGASSYGIRIDNPHEEQFRSHWHQEFVFQPQSMDGIVFWTPLVPMTPDLGPVIVCPGSHKDGLRVYTRHGDHAKKSGACQIGLIDEKTVAGAYDHVAPLVNPGDLILMDFLTIHQSGFNVSDRSRWSIQSRFFNFNDQIGSEIGWKASITSGSDVEKIFSENFI